MNVKINYALEEAKFKQMKQLEYLDLSYNNLTKEQITPLREALPNCKVVNWDYKH